MLIHHDNILWETFCTVGLQFKEPVGVTVYPKKYAHGFVVLCFVVVMQSFIMNSHEVFIHIHQGCFAGTGAIVRLPQCQWSKPGGYGKISQCITTTKQKPCAYFLGYTVFSACRINKVEMKWFLYYITNNTSENWLLEDYMLCLCEIWCYFIDEMWSKCSIT